MAVDSICMLMRRLDAESGRCVCSMRQEDQGRAGGVRQQSKGIVLLS
jgi:hypothetical protein